MSQLLKAREFETGSTDAHIYSREGKLDELRVIIEQTPEMINASDKNGWLPLHEAVRAGDPDVVSFLLEKGADVNSRTDKNGNGPSALNWALKYHDEDHPVVELLKSKGAKDLPRGHKAEL
jgi:ankyrin repeat protein